MTTNPQLPEDIPLDKPSPARMYDYFLGGHHNFAIDRNAAEQVRAIYPNNPAARKAIKTLMRFPAHRRHENPLHSTSPAGIEVDASLVPRV